MAAVPVAVIRRRPGYGRGNEIPAVDGAFTPSPEKRKAPKKKGLKEPTSRSAGPPAF